MGNFFLIKGRPSAGNPRGMQEIPAKLRPLVQCCRVLVLAAGEPECFRKGAKGNRKLWDI